MTRLRRRRRTTLRRLAFHPRIESLERRDVPSALSGPNDVITQAQPLGAVDPGQVAQVRGTIGNSPFGGAEVDWFAITVDQPERLTLTLGGSGVVSLYDNDSAVALLGHQLILQFDAAGPATVQSIDVLPGTYEVAVSGAGNRYFSPVIAGSGTVGAEGPYMLTVAGAQPDFDPTLPLAVVRTDIPSGGNAGSPLAINVYLSQPIDLTQDYVTILDANQNDLTPIVTLSPDSNDLVLTPLAGLVAGQYEVVGYDSSWNQILAIPFTVNAAPTTDTLASAASLGDITQAGLVQLPGVIGNDPYYSPVNSDPTASNPASQVNMYAFTVSGPGEQVLSAEAFAGRIGSPLNPALTLFRITGQNPDGSLAWQLVAGNDNTYNATVGSDGEMPLYRDAALFANLTAGRYVIAVSTTGNYADPLLGTQPGVSGVFDPNQSHSGTEGQTTGNYVLNLSVQPGATTPPQVIATSIQPGATLSGPPTQLTVQFSAPMNLAQLAVFSGQQFGAATASGTVDPTLLERFPCYIQDATGNRYFIALASYDAPSGVATFTVLQRLVSGQYFLHLSGPNGLTDLAGNPLAGNSISGDYVVPFTVTNSPARSTVIALANPNDSAAAPTDLGVLFPDELAAGASVQRDLQSVSPAPTDQADYYRFTLIQDTTVSLILGGTALTVAGRPVLLNANGNPLYPAVDPSDSAAHSVTVLLHAGTYTVMVGSWSPSAAAQAVYLLTIRSVSLPENPTPLTSGPAPAYRLLLDGATAPVGSSSSSSLGPAPSITVPTQGTPSIVLTVERSAAGALPSTSALAGATSGLAAGPAGVVSSPNASSNEAVRLVLPGTEIPTTTAVAITGPDARTEAAPSGVLFGAVEATLRSLVFYTLDWLQVPPLMPPSLLHDGAAPPSAAPADPEEAFAPAVERAGFECAARPIDAAAGGLALALGIGIVYDGDERKRRSLPW